MKISVLLKKDLSLLPDIKSECKFPMPIFYDYSEKSSVRIS